MNLRPAKYLLLKSKRHRAHLRSRISAAMFRLTSLAPLSSIPRLMLKTYAYAQFLSIRMSPSLSVSHLGKVVRAVVFGDRRHSACFLPPSDINTPSSSTHVARSPPPL